MKLTYEEPRVLIFNHIDNHGISRPSAAFDLMQDAATNHSVNIQMDKDTLGILWVLTRMRVRLTRPMRPDEPLRVGTTFDGLRGVQWGRSFSITAREGQIAWGRSVWVMLDPENHHVIRPNRIAQTAEMPKLERSDAALGKLSCDNLTPHHTHTVRYSDLDRNGHLNNARIVDLVSDGLECERMEDCFVSEMQVNFVSECALGERILLSVGQDGDGARYVFGSVGDQIKFEAEARLSALRV